MTIPPFAGLPDFTITGKTGDIITISADDQRYQMTPTADHRAREHTDPAIGDKLSSLTKGPLLPISSISVKWVDGRCGCLFTLRPLDEGEAPASTPGVTIGRPQRI